MNDKGNLREEIDEIRELLGKLNVRLAKLEASLEEREAERAPPTSAAEAPLMPGEVPIPPPYVEPEEVTAGVAEERPKPKEAKKGEKEARIIGYLAVRIGIVVILTGLVILGGYSFIHFGPVARAILIYLSGAVLLGVSSYLDKKTPIFARVLLGGGLAIIYFATYAIHFLPEMKILENKYFDLVLLSVVVSTIIALARWRKYPAIWSLALLLGYYTALVTELSLFSSSVIILLSLASLYTLWKYRWLHVSFIALFGSYITIIIWYWLYIFKDVVKFESLSDTLSSVGLEKFWLGLLILTVVFVIFNISAHILSRLELSKLLKRFFFAFNFVIYFILTISTVSGVIRESSDVNSAVLILFGAFGLAWGAFLLLKDRENALMEPYFLFGALLLPLFAVNQIENEILVFLFLAFATLYIVAFTRYKIFTLGGVSICYFSIALFTSIITLTVAYDFFWNYGWWRFLLALGYFSIYLLSARIYPHLVRKLGTFKMRQSVLSPIIAGMGAVVLMVGAMSPEDVEVSRLLMALGVSLLLYIAAASTGQVILRIISVILVLISHFLFWFGCANPGVFWEVGFKYSWYEMLLMIVFTYLPIFLLQKRMEGYESLKQMPIVSEWLRLVCSSLMILFLFANYLPFNYVTLSWGVFSFGLFFISFPIRKRTHRFVALGAFVLTFCRLVFYDLANLPVLYRILSFVVVGILLLVVAYIYARFRGQMARWD